jgi:outer membrane protein OmpA-like peptidoglycan-associated protein
VASGVDESLVRAPFEDFVVRPVRGGARPVGDDLILATSVARELRLGIDAGDPELIETAQRLDQVLGESVFSLRPIDASSDTDAFLKALVARLEEELLAGRLVVDRKPTISLGEREIQLPDLPPLPPARPPAATRSFEVRFVDEIGKAISGIDAEFTADGAQTRATNPAGIALLDNTLVDSATVAILDPDALAKALDPRWDKFRPGKPPKESNTQEVLFRGAELGPFSLKPEVPNTIVIKPPLGSIFVQLFDKTGRVRHANRTYQISGPQSFEGTTDDSGTLLHEDVFPGDYTLSLALDFFEEDDPDRTMDIVESPLVVLDAEDLSPQVRMIGAVPRSVLARLNMFFNTNKTFLLPTALPEVKKLHRLYVENAPCKLLVVGHADTRGTPDYNDKLSLRRAEATVAYLKDDVEGWFKFYSDPEPKQRWGKVEDHLMIISMRDFEEKPKGEDEVSWYQRTRGLPVDGDAGKDTRHALIKEYMSLDAASLADFTDQIEVTAHGCGENFPLDDSGEELDDAPADEKRDPIDRRVELFFFDPEFGITPPPPGLNSAADSPEYPLWRARVAETVELVAGDPDAPEVKFVELADAHFRTDSAVVLPEGENPDDSGAHEAITSVGVIATALRFLEGNPGKRVLVAGHTDTSAGDDHNQKLSEDRASVALAMLKGGDERDNFRTTCNARHKPRDVNQILSWAARELKDLGFDACDPGQITDFVSSAKVLSFQNAYNANQATLSSDPLVSPLDPDGDFGEFTWGAVFDCYELALQRELGEDAAGVQVLRDRLKFADPDHESLGFGEHFPIEELGVDEFRSQTNRRIEILFFDQGEEPDLLHAAEDPETSELYLPGNYEHTALPPLTDATSHVFDFRVHDSSHAFLPGAQVTLTFLDTTTTLVANAQGIATFTLPPVCPESVLLSWSDGTNKFVKKIFVECVDGPIESLARARLENLGYPALSDINLACTRFQLDYDLLPAESVGKNGRLPQQLLDELVKIWDKRACDARLPPPQSAPGATSAASS